MTCNARKHFGWFYMQEKWRQKQYNMRLMHSRKLQSKHNEFEKYQR